MTGIDQTIHKTKNYDQFVFLKTNRQINEGHVNALKEVSDQTGFNITEIVPVLVNEDKQVIDGQHRLEACRELDQPVFYKQVPGLTINDTRQMNTSQRPWKIRDYAESYAAAGNTQYKKAIELMDKYEIEYTSLMGFIYGGAHSYTRRFKEGEFELSPEEWEATEDRLKLYHELMEYMPHINKAYAMAFSAIVNYPDYDHGRMLKKMRMFGNHQPAVSAKEDAMRALEDIYNWRQTERTRLF